MNTMFLPHFSKEMTDSLPDFKLDHGFFTYADKHFIDVNIFNSYMNSIYYFIIKPKVTFMK